MSRKEGEPGGATRCPAATPDQPKTARTSARDEIFPCRGLEINRQGVDGRAAKPPEQLAVELKEDPQHLGDREDHLAVWYIEKKRLPHPLAPFLDPLGLARRAEARGAAGEHHQPLLPAVGAPDPGEAAARSSAVEIPVNELLDDRPEKAGLPLETALGLDQETLEMME